MFFRKMLEEKRNLEREIADLRCVKQELVSETDNLRYSNKALKEGQKLQESLLAALERCGYGAVHSYRNLEESLYIFLQENSDCNSKLVRDLMEAHKLIAKYNIIEKEKQKV